MAPITETEIPSEFICPLTLQVFENPLMSRDGMNYERDAIVEWLDLDNDSCPLTRKPLRLSALIHNMPLKGRIQQWKKDTGYQEEPSDEKNTHTNKGFRIEPTGLLIAADLDNASDEDEDDESVVTEEGPVEVEESASLQEAQTPVEEAQTQSAIARRNKDDHSNRAATDCASEKSRRGRNWLPSLPAGLKVKRRGCQ